jgi:hypothetical protein
MHTQLDHELQDSNMTTYTWRSVKYQSTFSSLTLPNGRLGPYIFILGECTQDDYDRFCGLRRLWEDNQINMPFNEFISKLGF